MGEFRWQEAKRTVNGRVQGQAPVELIDPTVGPPQSPMWPYLNGHAHLFRCPSHPAVGRNEAYNDGAVSPIVRTYGLNQWMGGQFVRDFRNLRHYTNLADLTVPEPGSHITFLSRHLDLINYPQFILNVWNAEKGPFYEHASLRDLPSAMHSNGTVIGYADGHASIHRWQHLSTRLHRTLDSNGYTTQTRQFGPTLGRNEDSLWLAKRMTAPVE